MERVDDRAPFADLGFEEFVEDDAEEVEGDEAVEEGRVGVAVEVDAEGAEEEVGVHADGFDDAVERVRRKRSETRRQKMLGIVFHLGRAKKTT